MEKLSMCRICLSSDIPLRSLVATHLQSMYEALTMTPLVAEDSRPSRACDLCCSRLEELFTQLLRHKAQVNLQAKFGMHLSIKDEKQTTADVLDNDDVQHENAEDDARDDSGASSDSEDVISVAVVKEEQSDVTANDAAVEQDDADPYHSALGLHTECDIPLDVVKEGTSDDDTGAPRLAAQTDRIDILSNSLKTTDQTLEKVEEPMREIKRYIEVRPLERNKIAEPRNNISVITLTRTSGHSDAHKEMSENKISADQSVNSSSSDKLRLWPCGTCQKCFRHKCNLKTHMYTHTDEKPYECDVCKKGFTQWSFLKVHMRTHTDDAAVEQDDADPYHSALGLHTECDIPLDVVKEEPDDVDTGTPRLAAQNNLNDTLLNSLKRTDQTMDKVEERNRETRRDIEDTPVEKNKIVETGGNIDIRLRNNKQRDSASDHSAAHKEMSENKISADQSVNSSSDDKLTPWSCATCQTCFKFKGELISHIRTHTGQKPYNCDVCKKCFNTNSHLIRHKRTQTHTGEKLYECNVCKKCFNQNRSLTKHKRTHTGEKSYECNVCKKCYIHKISLITHMRTHTGEKPYECNVCKKCFTVKKYLGTHMRTHTGEKPYKCNVCKNCFSRKGTLVAHMRTHTGEKPYECNVCKRCFSCNSTLFTHIRTHTGEKPYECNVCEKCFSQKSYLKLHMRTHTGEKPYECNICKKCFSTKSNLDSHMRTREPLVSQTEIS